MQPQQNKGAYGKGYGKRPLWQWIVIYIIVGGIVYAGIYYFVFAKNGGYNSSNYNYNYNYNYNTNAGTYTNTNTGTSMNVNYQYNQ